MAFDYDVLSEMRWVAVAAAPVYTNPSGSTTYVRSIILHNTFSGGLAVTLYRVPDSSNATGTAATLNQFFKDTIASEDTVFIEAPVPGIMLEDSHDTIQAVCESGSHVNVQIYGGLE